MRVKQINATQYANIYGVYDEEKIIGTVEIKIAGREAGKTFFYSLIGKYNKREIRRFFKEYR